ncbi:MAG: hypothetical protein Q9195_004765 [Heterodermia aff. obscurata]
MPRRLPTPPSDTPLHSFEETTPPPRPVSPIESLNTLDEDDFRIRFLPSDRHTGWLCCNGKANKGGYDKHRCYNVQPAEELFITLDPAPPEDTWEEDLVGVPGSLPAEYLVRFNTASNIRPEDLEACFKLVERTSSQDYKSSSVGWSAARKRQEMADQDMKYLLLTTSDGANFTTVYRVHGFLSFMLTREDEQPVIYCYEVHLWPSLRGRGIGSKLMRLMEEIGVRAGVQGSMLTVFTKNEAAEKLYVRMGYGLHDSSPSPRRLRGGRTKIPDYLILWKTLEGEWSDEESEESSEDASTKDGNSGSDVENEIMDIKEEMDVEDKTDFKDKGMDVKYEALDVKDEDWDVCNAGLDLKHETMDMKVEGMNVDLKGEEEKVMVKIEEHDLAIEDEQEGTNTKANVEGIAVKMKIEDD